MSKLVLVGGPPGVGKSTVLQHLARELDRCACLDADDVWRVHPLRFDDAAAGNVIAVLRGYLEAGIPLVVLAWVLANPALIDRILRGVEGLYDSALIVHLVASAEALRARSLAKFERGLTPEYQLLKVKQIEALPFPKIDTTGLEPEAVARRIGSLVR